ncbi:MAG: hypothetical protein IPJ69_11385 [Deltaproteobacteria bacterium]|nr:MAG: hypothetical protein IPJ69_11385 [Deltaproteobacteria bacterium]
MKKYLVLFLLVTSPLMAYSAKKEMKINRDPNLIKIRQQMSRMESNYFNLEILANSKVLNFDEVNRTLEDMEDMARKMRASSARKELDQSLKDLSKQIGDLKKEVKQEDPIHLRKGIDEIYQSCFRCHSLHASGK